jgi:phosphoribosyl-AMP cyclohydrolase
MKSTKPSPFDWAAKKPTLFTSAERASMNSFAVAKSMDRKTTHYYSKAKPNAK